MTGPAICACRTGTGTGDVGAAHRLALAPVDRPPPAGFAGHVDVRDATPAELAEVGELRVQAYEAQDLLSAASSYRATLRELGTAPGAEVLVAVEDGQLLGTVLLQAFGPAAEVARSPDEAELRALAVAPTAQGRGVGGALLDEAIRRARANGARHLVLSTQPAMHAAQRLYRAAGFVRLPDRDWSPLPTVPLLAFGLPLTATVASPGGQ